MKNKIVMILSILLGLMMANAGLNKFLHYMPMPEMSKAGGELMMAFMEAGWLFPLLAISEIVGGVMLMIPKFRALGAIIILPVIVGIFLFHSVLDPGGLIMSIVLLLINIWIIGDNCHKYMPMISSEGCCEKLSDT